jgi:hypothetical protein
MDAIETQQPKERNHTMTRYIVHLYREMRLTYADIEADSSEAAAAIARDKPTSDADDIEDCEGETLTALVDVVGDDQYEQPRFIHFEAERHRKAAPALLAACEAALFQFEHNGDESDSDRAVLDQLQAAIAQATAAGISTTSADDGPPPAATPYSVLLLYPDYASRQYGEETYYAFVTAADPIEAVANAQAQAVAAQEGVEIDDPEDFAPLLVTLGHHYGQPLFYR